MGVARPAAARMASSSPVPTTASTSGMFLRISSRYRSTRQPATISLRALPDSLCCAIWRMVSIDSCLALSMKEQVFTTRMSAVSGRLVISAPAWSSKPIMTSLSTRFLGQPRLTKPIRGRCSSTPSATPVRVQGVLLLALASPLYSRAISRVSVCAQVTETEHSLRPSRHNLSGASGRLFNSKKGGRPMQVPMMADVKHTHHRCERAHSMRPGA